LGGTEHEKGGDYHCFLKNLRKKLEKRKEKATAMESACETLAVNPISPVLVRIECIKR